MTTIACTEKDILGPWPPLCAWCGHEPADHWQIIGDALSCRAAGCECAVAPRDRGHFEATGMLDDDAIDAAVERWARWANTELWPHERRTAE